MRKIYLSHPVDLISARKLNIKIASLKKFFGEINCEITNSFEKLPNNCSDDRIAELVNSQVEKIKVCDFLVADLSIPNFTYVGCIGEIVYAHSFGKKVYAVVGHTGNENRLWLKFHVSRFFKSFDELRKFLQSTYTD